MIAFWYEISDIGNADIYDIEYMLCEHCRMLSSITKTTGVPMQPGLSWWCHQMETFSASLALCAGNSPVTGEFPLQMPVTRSFDVFFDLHPTKWLSKQSWGWWFETSSRSLWRHRNVQALRGDGAQPNSKQLHHRNVEKHIARTIVSWPIPKRW